MDNNDGKSPDKKREEMERVRIVARDEAEEAIESGKVITRDTIPVMPMHAIDTEPEATALSFPLVDVDATAQIVVRPRLAAPSATSITSSEGEEDGERRVDILDIRAEDRDFEDDVPEQSATPMSNLPHWTDPPSGEVLIGFGDRQENVTDKARWRGEHSGWDGEEISFDDLSEVSDFVDSSDKSGDPDVAAKEPTNDDAAGPAEPKSGGSRFREPSVIETAKSKLGTVSFARRVATAAVFAVVATAAFVAGPAATMALATIVIVIAAVEYFDAMRRTGYRPATLLGLVAIAGVMSGTYARGEAAVPLVLTLTAVFSFLWYLTSVIKGQPTSNVAATIFGFVWIGVLGSYAALLLRMPDRHGMAFVLGAVLCTVAYDSLAYVGGNVIGRTPLAAQISPSKTWEGLVVGTIASLAIGGFLVPMISPWGFFDGLALGVVVACVAPIGDLAESMIKRDLGLKDMGRILPGHGGVLDRFDALLFVLPATYYLVRVLDLG